jgi:hypothetical protein
VGYCAVNQCHVVVDLSGIDVLASIGIRPPVINAKLVANRGGKMLILNPSQRIVRSRNNVLDCTIETVHTARFGSAISFWSMIRKDSGMPKKTSAQPTVEEQPSALILQPGMIVQLKSGGPQMTVKGQDTPGADVWCLWFAGKKLEA